MELVEGGHDEEHALLQQLRQGQAAAYAAVMRKYNRRLFRAARGIVNDDAEAQDVVQEAYLQAFAALPRFRGEASLATWLTRIVINGALSQQRKLGRMVLMDDPASDEDDDAVANVDLDSASETPERLLQRQQIRTQLQEGVDGLPPLYRSVFMLRAVEGLSVKETADALGVTSDVVKTRYLRARALLRQSIDETLQREATHLYDFQGRRCDDVVASTLAALRATGLLRDH